MGTKKLSQDLTHHLMHTIGVLDEDANELVGSEVVQRERSRQDFKNVLRFLCDSSGGGRDRGIVVSSKHALKLLLLTMMVDTADALSLPMNPMVSMFWPHLGSLSLWILAAPITFCIFGAVFIMMPSQFEDSAELEPQVGTSGETSLSAEASTTRLRIVSFVSASATV